MKRETAQGIVASIRKVLEGRLGVSEKIAETFAARFVEGRPSAYSNPIERLSEREIEIFRLLGQGCDTRNIAIKLNISIKTVQTHCARMKEKLALSSAAELLREAMRWSEADSV
jgi:DNA-binding NarL/FixJ family response regulator